MAKLLGDRYFWYIVALIALPGIILYTAEDSFIGWLPSGGGWHETFMLFYYTMFLSSVAIAAWRFGVKGGLTVWLAIGLVLLPHALLDMVNPFRPDLATQLIIIGAIAVTFSWLIGSRRQAEEVLRESEEGYHTLMDLSAEVGEAIILLQDTEQGKGVQSLVNDEWPRITGYSKKELIGMSFFDLVHLDYREASIERHRQKMRGKVMPGLYELSIIRKDGVEVPIELTSSAATTYQGKRANIAYIRNISERKRATGTLSRCVACRFYHRQVSAFNHEASKNLK